MKNRVFHFFMKVKNNFWIRTHRKRQVTTSIATAFGFVFFCIGMLAKSNIGQAQIDWSNFSESITVGPLSNTSSVAVGDIDGDGDLDIITGNNFLTSAHINNGSAGFATRFFSSTHFQSVALGDMDGDGDLDVVAGGNGQNIVFLNDGAASFSNSLSNNFGTGENTQSIAIGDVNGDGYLDIVTGNYEQNIVYYNDGSAQFSMSHNFGSSAEDTRSVALGDVNRDGFLDVVTGNAQQSKVYLNIGDGVFQAGEDIAGSDAQSVALGDMDGDGDLDIIVGRGGNSWFGGQNTIHLNDGNGSFDLVGVNFGPGNDFTKSLAITDIDTDGDLDIVVGNSYISSLISGGAQNAIYYNDGLANLTSTSTFGTGLDDTYSVTGGDFDSDGDLDILTGNFGQDLVYFNNGSSSLLESRQFGLPVPMTSDIALGDVDGDGDLDIINSNIGLNQIHVNDGDGDFPVHYTFGTELGSRIVAVGDMNGDKSLDVVTDKGNIYVNDGKGAYLTNYSFDIGENFVNTLALADLDNDNDLDIAVGSEAQSLLFFNDGTGSLFSSQSLGSGATNLDFGDIDGDGNLDIVSVYGMLIRSYFNNGQGNFLSRTFAEPGGSPHKLQVGDVNGDGSLDIVTINETNVRIYPNDGMGSFTSSYSFGIFADYLSLGDMDGDGDLDIVVSNSSTGIVIYVNDGLGNFLVSRRGTILGQGAGKVVVGDLESDGDLDIVMGRYENHNLIYTNGLFPTLGNSIIFAGRPISTPNAPGFSTPVVLNSSLISVPFSLFDSDGKQVGAVKAYYSTDGGGNWQTAVPATNTNTSELTSLGLSNIVGYWPLNEGTLATTVDVSGNTMTATIHGSSWITNVTPILYPNSFALDFDGINDYVEVAHNPLQNPEDQLTLALWVKLDDTQNSKLLSKGTSGSGYTLGVADGKLYSQIWDLNGNEFAFQAGSLSSGVWSHLAITWQTGGDFRGYINGSQVWQVPASSLDIGPTSSAIRIGIPSWDTASYQLDGSIDDVRIYNRALSPTEISSLATGQCVISCNHVFIWDTFASGFYGRSDNVVLRLEAYSQPVTPTLPGTYRFTNTIPGPFQRPYSSVTTFPFRVRGTSVQVFTDTISTGSELENAIVYRLPNGQINGATLISNDFNNQAWHTDANGYLQGRGQLFPGDQIYALYPITSTDRYTLYHASAQPTEVGLDLYTVSQPGLQQLTVSSENKLILFNLVVSLEWDARQDATFQEQLRQDILRTSEILYDATNGQAALGQVHIYHDRGYWGQANVVIPASNTVRPSAILGGSVITLTDDIVSPELTISNAYIPGQVRMPPTWNRFGEPSGTLGEDWPRTLAHELVHYFFFHPDNYLGLSEAGLLQIIDCPGSIMSDPYLYEELLTRPEWDNSAACQQTLAQQYLDRADWETVEQFYPMLNTASTNSGPNTLPLAVTEIEFRAPDTPTNTLSAPFFRLVDDSGEPAPIPNGQAQAFLIKEREILGEMYPYVIAQGTPIGDILNARGAAPGDELCIFDYSQQPLRVGCQEVTNVGTSVMLYDSVGWEPQVSVSPITTDTVEITVSGVNDNELMAQLLPASGSASVPTMLTRQGDTFNQSLSAPDGAYYGYVRIWNPNSSQPREIIVEFLGSEDWGGRSYAWGVDPYDWQNPAYGWGGRSYAWGGRSYAWGGRSYAWGAPVMSNDGQVSVYPLDNLFGENADLSLQKLFLPPALDPWLIPVGQAYRFAADQSTGQAAILFQYLPRDVPAGYENLLRIYYSPDEGQTWQRLETELSTYRNTASAMMPGEGIYVLVATIEVSPSFAEGWNTFGFPVQETQTITNALASIDGRYTAVANYDPNRSDPWHTFYTDVSDPFTPLVNTLSDLEFTKAYWLYATEPVTLFLAPELPTAQLSVSGNVQSPPATYYGWVVPTDEFTPTLGMSVTAWINGNLCGEATIESLDGNLAYTLQVEAENSLGMPKGCGVSGRTVQFRVGEWLMDYSLLWDNSQAWFHSLDSIAPDSYSLYLPLVVRSGGVANHESGNQPSTGVIPFLILPIAIIGAVPVLSRRRLSLLRASFLGSGQERNNEPT
jgi:hypothetical protein